MTSAADYLPQRLSLAALDRAAADCRGCELYKNATQTVFGRGQRAAPLMLVGEMPGDREDRLGAPFVGPAGQLLGEVLNEAGIGARDVYLTNVVKHFRWEERGKRRLHKKPGARQITACKPWLHAEILVVEPKAVVCLGATAAQAMLGGNFRITKQHGKFFPGENGDWLMATYHPSAILRAPNNPARRKIRDALVADLRRAAKRLG